MFQSTRTQLYADNFKVFRSTHPTPSMEIRYGNRRTQALAASLVGNSRIPLSSWHSVKRSRRSEPCLGFCALPAPVILQVSSEILHGACFKILNLGGAAEGSGGLGEVGGLGLRAQGFRDPECKALHPPPPQRITLQAPARLLLQQASFM